MLGSGRWHSSRSPLLALLLPALLLGCDSDLPTQPLAPEAAPLAALQINDFIPLEGLHVHRCTGEILYYTGWVQVRLHESYDRNGGYHGNYIENEHIVLVNPDTGDEYLINFIWKEVLNEKPDFPVHYTRHINQAWVGKGPLVDRPYRLRQSITINANGEATVDWLRIDSDCR